MWVASGFDRVTVDGIPEGGFSDYTPGNGAVRTFQHCCGIPDLCRYVECLMHGLRLCYVYSHNWLIMELLLVVKLVSVWGIVWSHRHCKIFVNPGVMFILQVLSRSAVTYSCYLYTGWRAVNPEKKWSVSVHRRTLRMLLQVRLPFKNSSNIM